MQRVCKTCLLLPQYFRVHEEDIGQSPHFLVGFFEGTRQIVFELQRRGELFAEHSNSVVCDNTFNLRLSRNRLYQQPLEILALLAPQALQCGKLRASNQTALALAADGALE
jgi:hypothetical protein